LIHKKTTSMARRFFSLSMRPAVAIPEIQPQAAAEHTKEEGARDQHDHVRLIEGADKIAVRIELRLDEQERDERKTETPPDFVMFENISAHVPGRRNQFKEQRLNAHGENQKDQRRKPQSGALCLRDKRRDEPRAEGDNRYGAQTE
jgi:hypothetical protein